MLDYTNEQLEALGAAITAGEIYQQPDIWKKTFQSYLEKADQIAAFLEEVADKHDYIKVIFTGAGTSAYVGDTLLPYLRQAYDERKWSFYSVATTDLVTHPLVHLKKDVPLVLVSFARSGNSPESVAAVDLARELVDSFYQITITCAQEGQLAQQAQGDPRNLLLLQPEESNDKGFAMTTSFSSMLLTALLVFDPSNQEDKEVAFAMLEQLSRDVLAREKEVETLAGLGMKRVIYLGSGPFFGLAHEAQLKILELTAGKLATMYESPVGFRHGPKSLIDEETLVIVFGSSDPYTRAYDLDLVREVAGDQIAKKLVYFTDQEQDLETVDQVVLPKKEGVSDVYRAFPYILYGQLLALLTAIQIGNTPDTPSPSGTVNRVVQGVRIHPF